LSFDNVPIDTAKTYTVDIRMDGYKSYTSSGTISPGQNVVINAALTPLTATPQPTATSPLSPMPVLGALSVMGIISLVMMKRQRD
jgi:hypothetical protein